MSKQAIAIGQVRKMQAHYAKNKNSILKDSFQLSDTLPTFEIFDRDSIDQILALDGCVGIRMYYAMDDDMQVKLIAVGVDKDGQDIQSLDESMDKNKIDNSVIAFSSVLRCPPECGPINPPPPPPDQP